MSVRRPIRILNGLTMLLPLRSIDDLPTALIGPIGTNFLIDAME